LQTHRKPMVFTAKGRSNSQNIPTEMKVCNDPLLSGLAILYQWWMYNVFPEIMLKLVHH